MSRIYIFYDNIEKLGDSRMTISRSVKVWVIVNAVILSIVPVFFILGLLYSEYWVEIIDFADIIIVPLILHIFYQGFYIGGFVLVITLGILVGQICDIKKVVCPYQLYGLQVKCL